MKSTRSVFFSFVGRLLPLLFVVTPAFSVDYDILFGNNFKKKSVWQWIFGEKTYATLNYGYWYTWWIPTSLGEDQRSFTVKMQPAWLKESSFHLNARGKTNFILKYVTDEFFKEFEQQTDLRFTNEQKTSAKELFASLKQQLPLDWPLYIYGRAIIGEFRGAAEGARLTGFYAENAAVANTTSAQLRSWSTRYSEYELDAILGFVALGARFIDYDRPFNVFFTPLTSSSITGGERSGTYLSSYRGTYINFGFIVHITADKFFAEADSLYGVGWGTVKNNYMSDMSANGFYFDNAIKFGPNIVSFGDWVDIRIYIGYRLRGMVTKIGDITGYDDNPQVKLKQASVYEAGREGRVYAAEWDWFHGPVFGASLRF